MKKTTTKTKSKDEKIEVLKMRNYERRQSNLNSKVQEQCFILNDLKQA